MVMKKQLKYLFTEFVIGIGITLLFMFGIFTLFLIIRILLKKNGIEWEQAVMTAYILVRAGFRKQWDFSSIQSVSMVMLIFHILFVSITIFLFVLKFHRNYDFWKKFKLFFNRLPIKNRILLCWFTFIFAIPNKVWINTESRFITIGLGQLSIVYFCYLEPIMLFFLMDLLNVFFFSGFFAYMYENNFERYPLFQIKVKKYLFNSSDEFAKFYFDFFWGNMFSTFQKKGKTGIFLFGSLYYQTVYKKHVVNKLHIELYDKSISDFTAANEKGALTVDVMRMLRDDTRAQALNNHSTPFFTAYEGANKKISDAIEKFLSSGF